MGFQARQLFSALCRYATGKRILLPLSDYAARPHGRVKASRPDRSQLQFELHLQRQILASSLDDHLCDVLCLAVVTTLMAVHLRQPK